MHNHSTDKETEQKVVSQFVGIEECGMVVNKRRKLQQGFGLRPPTSGYKLI